jgi:hypothetical protein
MTHPRSRELEDAPARGAMTATGETLVPFQRADTAEVTGQGGLYCMPKKKRFLKRLRRKALQQVRLAIVHHEPIVEWSQYAYHVTQLQRFSHQYPGALGWNDIDKLLGPSYPRLLGSKR